MVHLRFRVALVTAPLCNVGQALSSRASAHHQQLPHAPHGAPVLPEHEQSRATQYMHLETQTGSMLCNVDQAFSSRAGAQHQQLPYTLHRPLYCLHISSAYTIQHRSITLHHAVFRTSKLSAVEPRQSLPPVCRSSNKQQERRSPDSHKGIWPSILR